MWVELIVRSQIMIRDDDSLEILEERLRLLPEEVEGLYSRMLSRTEGFYRKEAAWYLQMTLSFTRMQSEYGGPAPNIYNFAIAKFVLSSHYYVLNDLVLDNTAAKCEEIQDRMTLAVWGS